MNSPQPPDPHAFIHDPVDPAAIRNYLSLTKPGEIARLAAAMAPRPTTFDADALVEIAIALRMAAEAGLIRQREAMAARMNLNTLFALRTQLGCSDNLTADEHFSDPVKGPVLRSIQTFWIRVEIDAEKSNGEFVRRALDAADARTKIPRPKIPCDLEPALRYAANAPETPWPVLEHAFKDSLGYFRILHRTKQDENLKEDLARELARETNCLANLRNQPSSDPRTGELKSGHHKRIKEVNDRLDELKSINHVREYFIPGMEIPPSIAAETDNLHATTYQQAGSVWRPDILAHLATDFHDFWKCHGPAYAGLHAKADHGAKTAAKAKQLAGKKGVLARENARWINHTQNFISNLKAQPEIGNPEKHIPLFVNSTVSDHGARGRLTEFLNTLCNTAAHRWQANAAHDTLAPVGIAVCDLATVTKCLDLLKPVIKRKSKKV